MSQNPLDPTTMISSIHSALESTKLKSPEELAAEKAKAAKAVLDAEDDYEFTKRKLKELVDIAKPVVDAAATIAEETQDARHFDAFANLLGQVADIANSVVNASKVKSDIDKNRARIGEDPTKGTTNITHTNATVFVGSSKEILKKLKGEAPTIDGVATEVKNDGTTTE